MKSKHKSLASIAFRHTACLTGAAFVLAAGSAMADTTLSAPLVLTTPAGLGAITRTADGATLTLTGAGYTTTNADINGILGGWAVINNGDNTYSWAHNDGVGTIIVATPVTLGTSFSGVFSTNNWINSDGATTLTAATTVNSFTAASDITVSGLLTVGSGGMILGNNGSKFIKNGTSGQLTSGMASGELFVYAPNTTAIDTRIQVPIVNGSASTILVKDGAGRLDLDAANTYTGKTILNQGSLYLRNAGALGSTSGILVTGNVAANLSTNVTTSAPLTGAGTFNLGTVDGGASWNLTGDLNGFQGTLTYQSGTGGRNNVNLGGTTDASMDMSNAKIALTGATTGGSRALRLAGTGPANTFKVGDLSGAGQLNVNNLIAVQVGALGLSNTFSGVIQQSGNPTVATTASLAKVGGASTLTLSGANNYTGATTISAGTLQVGNGTTGSIAAGSAVTVGASGTLALNLVSAGTFSNAITNGGIVSAINGNDMTLSSVITGGGSLQKSGAGILTVSASSSYNGPTTVSAGTLKVTGSIASSALSLGAGTLTGTGSVGGVTVNNSAAVISNGDANTTQLSLGSLAFSTVGTFNLNKFNNTTTPAIAVANNLNIGPGFTVNVTTAPTWTSGLTYNLITCGSLTGLPANVVKGTIPGLGARQSAAIGTTATAITLTISGVTPVWTGVASGTWSTTTVGSPFNWKTDLGGTPTQFLTNDSVLFNDTATGTKNVTINDNTVSPAVTTFDNSVPYTLTGSGGINTGSLSKLGTGTVTISTTNSYTGATTIQNGVLQLGNGSANGEISTSSGIANDGSLIYNRTGGSFTYANIISGIGTVVKDGTGSQILTGTNTYSGGTTINAGIMQVGNGGTTGRLGAGLITDNASLVFNRTDTVAQGTDFGTIDGTGSVTHAGAGTLALSSVNGYAGGTTVNAGTLSLANGGALGSGAVTLNSGTLQNTATIGVANDIAVSTAGTIKLGGGVNFTLTGALSGSGALTLAPAGGPLSSLNVSFSANSFSGTITIPNSTGINQTVTRFNTAAAGSATAAWSIGGAQDRFTTLNFIGDGTLDFGSLTGTGTIRCEGTGVKTLSVGALGTDTTFAGVLTQNAGSLGLTKVGAGKLTLTGANTHTGVTTVSGGVLAVNGTAIPNAGQLVINGGKVEATGTEVVDTLYFGTTQQASGTWGATDSGATHIDNVHFTGTSGVVSVTTAPVAGYTTWADANGATGQTMDQDHDNDGVSNGIEYFMGQTGSTFTSNPALVGGSTGTVTWPMGASYTGTYGTDYEVQTSPDLVTWTQASVATGPNTVTVTNGVSVVYTMPASGTKLFVRLVVKN